MRVDLRTARSRASRLVRPVVRRLERFRDPEFRTTPCSRGRYVTAHTARPPGDAPDRQGVDDTTVVITSATPGLFTVARSFLDEEWPVYVIDGSEGCYGFPAVRHTIENTPARWAILLDEDAFILDNDRLHRLVAWAARSGHAAVGVPDGGVISHRTHNPNALNLFFNILDLASIRDVWDARSCRRWSGRGSEMTRPWPPGSLLNPDVPYRFDDYEPYYCLYFWLADVGLSTGYLGARDHSDGLSTVVLDHEGQPVLIHTWYGREFEREGPMRERILDAVAYARGEPDRGARWRGHDW